MNRFNSILNANRNYFTGYSVFLFFGLLLFFFTTKTDGFLFINTHHDWLMDDFFRIYTYAGDGIFCVVVFLLLLVLKKRLLGWELIITMALSGLITQIIKNIFPMPRPRTFLGDANYHHFIDGVTRVGYASFPSGHTATAFGMATILAISGKNKKWSFVYLTAALLVGWSRIYLGQHFLQDVLAGSLIGVMSAIVIHATINNRYTRFLRLKSPKESIPDLD